MLHADELIPQLLHAVLGLGEDLGQARGEMNLPRGGAGALDLGNFRQGLFRGLLDRAGRYTGLFQEGGCHAAFLFQERQ